MALVPIIDVIRMGELSRKAAMSIFGKVNGNGVSQTLAGKDRLGRKLDGHLHAHFLPSDEDGDGYLDHLTIWAPLGFDKKEEEALKRLYVLYPIYSDNGNNKIRLNLITTGQPKDLERLPMFGSSHTWHSVTPFVLTRHPKLRNNVGGYGQSKYLVDGPVDQLRLELSRRDLPEPQQIKFIDMCLLPKLCINWKEFCMRRGSGGGSGIPVGYGFQLVFEEPISGPLALGYGCHFGLGQFVSKTQEI